MSRRITSGFKLCASCMHDLEVPQSATTLKRGSASRMIDHACLTNVWSSAIRTLIGVSAVMSVFYEENKVPHEYTAIALINKRKPLNFKQKMRDKRQEKR